MMLQIQYARSLEAGERVRRACLAYLQSGMGDFYPERPDIVSKLQTMAAHFGGRLVVPRLERKYSWTKPVFGYKAAKSAQRLFPE